MSRFNSCHIVCYQKCRYFFINKKKIGSKKTTGAKLDTRIQNKKYRHQKTPVHKITIVPVFYMALGLNVVWQIHYSSQWKGWALKI
jgi:hypothetical protein